LREFIELEFPQESPKGRYTQVAVLCEAWTHSHSAIFGHAPKFVDQEEPTAQAHSILGKNRLPFRGNPNAQGNEQHRQPKHEQNRHGDDNIKNAPGTGDDPPARRRGV
jgi:hypothetical protein